ncbi:MAG: GNAT family N-acetyltransferase [Patescibacteria group bacterium]
MHNITIRPAKEEDYEQLLRLYSLFTERDYSGHDNDAFKKVLQSDTSFIFVAEHETMLIGTVLITVRDVIRYARPIAEVDELFVLEAYRKQGVGKQLMHVVEEKTKELNCQRIYLESASDRKAAHAFYEKLGYTNYGFCFKKDL